MKYTESQVLECVQLCTPYIKHKFGRHPYAEELINDIPFYVVEGLIKCNDSKFYKPFVKLHVYRSICDYCRHYFYNREIKCSRVGQLEKREQRILYYKYYLRLEISEIQFLEGIMSETSFFWILNKILDKLCVGMLKSINPSLPSISLSDISPIVPNHDSIAQMVEHVAFNHRVEGSIPSGVIKNCRKSRGLK